MATGHPWLSAVPITELKYPNGIKIRQERPRFENETLSFPGERHRYPLGDHRQEQIVKLEDKKVVVKDSGIYLRDGKVELLPSQVQFATEYYLYIIYGGPGDKVEKLLPIIQSLEFKTFH